MHSGHRGLPTDEEPGERSKIKLGFGSPIIYRVILLSLLAHCFWAVSHGFERLGWWKMEINLTEAILQCCPTWTVLEENIENDHLPVLRLDHGFWLRFWWSWLGGGGLTAAIRRCYPTWTAIARFIFFRNSSEQALCFGTLRNRRYAYEGFWGNNSKKILTVASRRCCPTWTATRGRCRSRRWGVRATAILYR